MASKTNKTGLGFYSQQSGVTDKALFGQKDFSDFIDCNLSGNPPVSNADFLGTPTKRGKIGGENR
jgi:hypothetical protein